MKTRKSLKKAFLTTVTSLVLCVSMLLGTTFAWFTDSVTSGNNKIIAGNLAVDLELLVEDDGTPEWESIKTSRKPIFNYANWEPGYYDVKVMKIENEGSLSLNWKALFVPQGEVGILADVIDVYLIQSETELSYPSDRKLTGYEKVCTLREFMTSSSNYLKGSLDANASAYFGLALMMRTEAGNEYQNQALPTFDIQILASQAVSESDSFGNDYDYSAVFPNTQINFLASKPIEENKIDTATNELVEEIAIGAEDSFFKAVAPAGLTLADGADTLDLTVQTVEKSEANVTLDDNQVALSVDVHVEGVAETNTVPMQVVLKNVVIGGLNDNNIQLYHVEDGVTVQMTAVATMAELDAHNEFYYNAVTGDITLSLASFSEVRLVAHTIVHWDGVSATAFAGGTGTEADPYLIANASQLAYFRDVVDGKAENWTADTTFEGKYVKLTSNIFLNHEAEFEHLFDPIGWGYSYSKYNRDGAPGKVFKGTFDGDNYSIHGLWQNGWDLEAITGTDYTYTNCGGGLFAAVENATIKNLGMVDAVVTYECVEIGIVVGLAQGNCTFENILVFDSKIANYQRPTGGIVGEVSPSMVDGQAVASTTTFKDIVLDTSVVVGTLWGDFDAPVGGVIGARWDDANKCKVKMNNVKVACELDVYNDVTSTYQWYAYRRAGMLIGNTEEAKTENGRTVATASFLTCENVLVYYTNWAKYNYCQFTNYNSSWPWVRVQAGENCNAYSNPRYGVPNDASGNKVTGFPHTHKEGDQCNVQIYFDQLYGGGQGVYGEPKHAGVRTDVKYLITFLHDDHVASIRFITDNSNDHTVTFPDTTKLPHLDQTKQYEWVDRNGATISSANKNNTIPAGNIRDIFYYLTEKNKVYAHFVDKDGFLVAEFEVNSSTGKVKNPETGAWVEISTVVPAVPEVPGYNGIWEPYTLKGATHDVIINAVYSKSDHAEVLTTADQLFELLGKGHHLAMSQDLDGGFGSSNKTTFCTVVNNPAEGKDYTARVDLNSFTLHYNGDAGGNKNWTLFHILGARQVNGKSVPASKLTVGDGFAGFGFLYFDLTKLNGNAKPTIFHLEKDATLILERGVVIELRYPKNNDNIIHPFSGVSDYTDKTKYPGLNIEKLSTDSNEVYRITVTARTVLVGDGTDARE